MNYKLVARRLRAMADALDGQALNDMSLKEYLKYLKENLNDKSVLGHPGFKISAEGAFEEPGMASLTVVVSGFFPNIPHNGLYPQQQNPTGNGIDALMEFEIEENPEGGVDVEYSGDMDDMGDLSSREEFDFEEAQGVTADDVKALIDSRAPASEHLSLYSKAIQNVKDAAKAKFGDLGDGGAYSAMLRSLVGKSIGNGWTPLAIDEVSGGCSLHSTMSNYQDWNNVKPLVSTHPLAFHKACERTWNQDPLNPIVTITTFSDGSGVKILAPWLEIGNDGLLSDISGEIFDDPQGDPECAPGSAEELLNTIKIVAATSKSKIQEIIDQL